jgi:hypothetical protein
VKQRTLLSLGRKGDGQLEALAEAVAKRTGMITAMELAKNIAIEDTYILGPLLVTERLFEQLGIDEALARVQRAHKKLGFKVRNVVYELVASRFVRPTSKLASYEKMRDKLYPGMLSKPAELHQLYRALDVLAEGKDDIEQSLFMHGRDLLSANVDVVLYDLTTLRFESTVVIPGELRQFGFSKEKRSDCTQVVLGLLIDPDGIPLGFEVFPGNTFEGKTLLSIVEKIRRKFNVRRFIFVADRGLLSAENLNTIRAVGGEFIVGMRIGGLAKKRPELFDRNNFRPLNQRHDVSMYETTFGEDRGFVTWTKERAERDANVRADIIAKIKKKLTKSKVSAKAFVSNANYHAFIKGLDTGTPVLDEKKIAAAAAKDGFFAIVSNVPDLSATDLYAQYRQLWRIEDAFGEFKGTLKARPIFHWTDKRIIGHLTMCFIALLCEAHVARALRQKLLQRKSPAIDDNTIRPRPLAAASVFAELAELRAVPISLAGQKIWVRTDIKGHVAKLFLALGLRIPPRVLTSDFVVAQTVSDAAGL